MTQTENKRAAIGRRIVYRGREAQVPIYLGKLLRGFLYLNDWKLLPMSALIAALVAMVIHYDFGLTMEGTLIGALALSCISVWNGCFNSVQVVCRERQIVKREHRSGMHISSYIFSHMLYQALLCCAQTIITLYVCSLLGVRLSGSGFISSWLMLDYGITFFLITYAADMLSLLISCIAHSTTAAMTIMPFILIFQLVFSGGLFHLPSWAQGISEVAITRHGITCLAAQADYNGLPSVTGWNTIKRLRKSPIEGDVTVGQILDLLSDEENPAVASLRESELEEGLTFGEVIDLAAASPEAEENREQKIHYATTVDELLSIAGEEETRTKIEAMSSEAAQREAYEHTKKNICTCWGKLALFSLIYAALAVLLLEFIDKDRR